MHTRSDDGALPWHYPSKSGIRPKTFQYYNSTANLWDNPHLTCKKVANFFHAPNHSFRQTHPSDDDIRQLEVFEREGRARTGHLMNKRAHWNSLNSRKAEREMLQLASSQKMEEGRANLPMELSISSPDMATEMRMRKSLGFKNPSKKDLIFGNSMYNYNDFTEKQLRSMLTPQVMKFDKEACDRIAKKIENESASQENLKNHFQQQRLKSIENLKNRHMEMKELVKSSGLNTSSLKQYEKLMAEEDLGFAEPHEKYEAKTLRNQKLQELVSRLSIPTKSNEGNIFQKSEFRGLIHPNYFEALNRRYVPIKERETFLNSTSSLIGTSGNESKKSMLSSASCVQLKQSSTHYGFPFPAHAGVAFKKGLQPLSKAVSVSTLPHQHSRTINALQIKQCRLRERVLRNEQRDHEDQAEESQTLLHSYIDRQIGQKKVVGYPGMKSVEMSKYESLTQRGFSPV